MSSDTRPTPTIEDYLGAIYTLTRDNQPVIGRKLAEWMEVSPPTVTATIQRMIRDGWVTMHADKTIHLTEAGQRAAASVVRRHMLTELLLARILNVPWSRVHQEADLLEHGLSADTAARLAEFLDEAAVCPHGNPLPGEENRVSAQQPLLEATPGRRYLLARVHEEIERQSDLMAFLEERGLVPGAVVRLVALHPEEGTIGVEVNQADVTLDLGTARCLWVQEASGAAA